MQNDQMAFEATIEFAQALDQADPLRSFRDQFHFPINEHGQEEIYFAGNSLGLQPKIVSDFVNEELEKWNTLGVRGHFESDFPWMPYHEFLSESMAQVVGAKAEEVVVMNSLTTNLHLMMATFYRPTAGRHKILIEEHAFPSDHYAVESQVRFHGFDPAEAMLIARPRDPEDCFRCDDLLELISDHADELALVMLPGVQYYTGQRLDIDAISELAKQNDIPVGFDLAHAAGNVQLNLHETAVDFAVWCNYKYLNSGPGAVGACFVHEDHFGRTDLPRLAGWWGHDKTSRFLMQNEFSPIPTAEGWQLSNPPILSLAAIRASLSVFEDAGGMPILTAKSRQLTGYFEWLLQHELGTSVRVITPADPAERGCQLSMEIEIKNVSGKSIQKGLEKKNVTTDWREPNVIRAAPVPLYNSFEDVFHFVSILKRLLV